MQQYQNPNYMMYQQPQYNPYMQRMENLQQFQQAIQQPVVPTSMSGANQFTPLGKIVESMDMVKVADIPMDGNMYYFPKADGTEIYSKQFGTDGKTRILTFKPYYEDDTDSLSSNNKKMKIGISDEVTEVFLNMLNQINARLENLEASLPKSNTRGRIKKEVDESE